jgi:predicted glycogen debranching enzyme
MSGRGYHSLHRANDGFGFTPEHGEQGLTWRPYPGLPPVNIAGNGAYRHEPLWYRNFLYTQEEERGLDAIEDLASPGSFTFDLVAEDAVMILDARESAERYDGSPELRAHRLLREERQRRGRFVSPLHRAADAYIVRRGEGRTIIAGYPWFTDWGRDTFITLRGLFTVPGGLELGRDVLLGWAATESRGMLPNRFPDAGATPEYNSVDAALWFVIAAHELMQAARRSQMRLSEAEQASLRDAIQRILRGYIEGSRYGIRVDGNGLLMAGEPGVQLTWMDVKIGDWVVTPRIGKPVEIQALWLNALAIGRDGSADLHHLHRRARASFQARFWNPATGCLYDVVDADHVPDRNDPSLRPNQILEHFLA